MTSESLVLFLSRTNISVVRVFFPRPDVFLCARGALVIRGVQIPTEALDRETVCASVECFFCCLLCCRLSRIEAIWNKCVGMDQRSVEAEL